MVNACYLSIASVLRNTFMVSGNRYLARVVHTVHSVHPIYLIKNINGKN